MDNIDTEPQVMFRKKKKKKERTSGHGKSCTQSNLKNTKCSFLNPVGCIDEGREEKHFIQAQ